MGLAATQARFLAITSRKANCEFRTMDLAQKKLSLSRELEEATLNYNNAIEAAKIIWDVDGTGQYRYNLSYGLLMQPSDLNQYLPYLVSRQDGKIAVDEKMKAALEGIVRDDGGIWYTDPEGATTLVYLGDSNYEFAKQEAFNAFIDGLIVNHAIPSSIGTTLWDGHNYTYIPNAGLGGELFGRETANTMYIGSVMTYIDNLVSMAANGTFSEGSKEFELAQALVFDFGDSTGQKHYLMQKHEEDNGNTSLYRNHSFFSDGLSSSALGTSQYSFTLSDLLTDNITLNFLFNPDDEDAYKFKTNFQSAISSITSLISSEGADYLVNNSMEDWFNKAIGNPSSYAECPDWCKGDLDLSGDEDYKYGLEFLQGKAELEYDERMEANTPGALPLAIINFVDKLAKSMYKLFMPNAGNEDNPTLPQPSEHDKAAFHDALQYVLSTLTFDPSATKPSNCETLQEGGRRWQSYATESMEAADNYNCWVKSRGTFAISLSNLTEGFLSKFIDGIEDYSNNCVISHQVTNSHYITDDPDYLYTINLPENEVSLQPCWEAEFYSIIFNNICYSGWYENQKINDNAYLNNALKNAQLFITSLDEKDFNYYQTRYAQVHGGHVMEETDEDAVAQAEREYTYTKNRINYKEQRIELETKSVDAELLSLNTEYETVKNLIAKNIDNTFKQFQS